MSARIVNPRLWMALRRPPMPRAAVLGVVDAFDRCDPTRSRESKPSVRLREAVQARRLLRAVVFTVVGLCVLTALLTSLS